MKNIVLLIMAALLFASFTTVDTVKFPGNLERESEPNYKPGLDVLQSYTGTYSSFEIETFYTLELSDSTLMVHVLNGQVVKLEALKEDHFKGNVYFISEMKFIRNGADKVTGFEVSNELNKGIRFERY